MDNGNDDVALRAVTDNEPFIPSDHKDNNSAYAVVYDRESDSDDFSGHSIEITETGFSINSIQDSCPINKGQCCCILCIFAFCAIWYGVLSYVVWHGESLRMEGIFYMYLKLKT